ncbi:MAG: hypothetical protein WA081_12525 [Desulfosalsimonadaceae bacterium]
MNVQTKPLAEINQKALNVLCRELGVVSTVRFINQFTTGYGNYTEDREELFKDLSLDQIISDIKQMRKQKNLPNPHQFIE